MRREIAVLGGVVRALEVIDVGADVDAARQRRGSVVRGREVGELREREVDLRQGALGPVVLDALDEVRVEVDRIDQAEQGALGVGVRDDGARRDLLAAREHDARRGAVLRLDARDLGIRADLRAERLGGRGQRLRERAHPALRNRGGTRGVGVARRLEEDAQAGPRGPRAGEAAVDAARRDRGPEELVLEELGDEVRDRHRSPAEEAKRIAAGQCPEAAPDAEHLPHLAERWVVDRRRRHRHERLEHPADPGEALLEREVALRVVGRDLLELRGRPLRVAVESDALPVETRREDAHLALDPREAVPGEAEILRDRRQERSRDVQHGGAAEAGGELLGDREAADLVPPLQHDRLESRLREVARRDQPVGAGSDDGDAAAFAHASCVRPVRASSPRGASRPRSCRSRP
jgi:hypothetical protein